MKKTTLSLALATALITSMAMLNCSKKEDPAPAATTTAGTTTSGTTTSGTTTSGTTTSGTTTSDPKPVSIVLLNTWVTSRGSNATYTNVLTEKYMDFASGSNTRNYRFVAYTNKGTPQAKTASLYLAFNDTVNAPATGRYTLVGLQNSVPGPKQVFITHAGTSPSGTFFSAQNGGIIDVINNDGVISFAGYDMLGSNSSPTTTLSLNLKY